MISFGELCYSNQYDEISDYEFSYDEISGFANTTKFLTTKFPPPAAPASGLLQLEGIIDLEMRLKPGTCEPQTPLLF